MMKLLGRLLLGLITLIAVLLLVLKLRYGGGRTDFPDRSGPPTLPESALEVVAELPTPPGNIAVSADGRVFVSLHPEARPSQTLVELVVGKAQPWPNAEAQSQFTDVLGIRIDRQQRLWTLDNGGHGAKPVKLTAFDVASGKVVREIVFDRSLAGLGSHYNDLQVSSDGSTIYIADASFFGLNPALVVVDVASGKARRLLERHVSVTPEKYIPVVQGRRMEAFGLVAIRPGVDSIALSRNDQWLYYAPITSERLYRIHTADLRNEALGPEQLAGQVETLAAKTMSDGITSDDQGRIYLSDLEHSAIVRYAPDTGAMETLIKTDRLRWPDGFSFGPEGWLYVTGSALHQVIGLPPSSVAEHAPYPVFRFQPGASAAAGH
ncbi:MAG: L-dopachrome tautomerase-related protein [Stagnimonas sp.]|nr:L-dopachrome tautomerase-related protein [Stagnimonas sp.]